MVRPKALEAALAKTRQTVQAAGAAFILCAVFFVSVGAGPTHLTAVEPDDTDAALGLVLVELFTSQGCSSCPPADALLRELAKRNDVLALSYHVDYWNRLGWRDPFSKRKFTERQESYARALGLDTIFTPQVIIDGMTSLVGSDRAAVLGAVDQYAAVDKPRIELDIEHTDGVLTVVARTPRAALEHRPRLQLVVGVAQSGLETPVRSGENRGKTLRHDGVVRELSRFALERQTTSVELPIEANWRALTVFAFLQDPRDLAVLSAGKRRVPLDD